MDDTARKFLCRVKWCRQQEAFSRSGQNIRDISDWAQWLLCRRHERTSFPAPYVSTIIFRSTTINADQSRHHKKQLPQHEKAFYAHHRRHSLNGISMSYLRARHYRMTRSASRGRHENKSLIWSPMLSYFKVYIRCTAIYELSMSFRYSRSRSDFDDCRERHAAFTRTTSGRRHLPFYCSQFPPPLARSENSLAESVLFTISGHQPNAAIVATRARRYVELFLFGANACACRAASPGDTSCDLPTLFSPRPTTPRYSKARACLTPRAQASRRHGAELEAGTEPRSAERKPHLWLDAPPRMLGRWAATMTATPLFRAEPSSPHIFLDRRGFSKL